MPPYGVVVVGKHVSQGKKMDGQLGTWNEQHIYKVRERRSPEIISEPDTEKLRHEIEPWLTALFQSEHLSLFLGGGISSALHRMAKNEAGAGMAQIAFSVFREQVEKASSESALKSGRGEPNIEDQIRVCNELIKGLGIYVSEYVYG